MTFGRVVEGQSSPGPEELANADLKWMKQEFPRVADSIERTIEDSKDGYGEFEKLLRLIIGYPTE